MKKLETGGTADSAENGGANVGGTLGSSMMKTGGGLKGKQKNLDLNKNGKLDSEDFKMIRGKMKTGGEVEDVSFSPVAVEEANIEQLFEMADEIGLTNYQNLNKEVLRKRILEYFKLNRFRGRMKTGGSIGDNHTVTLETFEIYMPKFQTYLKSKNIKFKKHNNSQEVDYYGTYSSLKSMIDKWWAMDSDKEEKQEYYDLIEKTTKMKTGGSVDSNYEKIVEKLEKEFEGQDLWDDEILDEYEVKQFDDRTNPVEIDKFVNAKKKKFYVVPFDYGDDSYYYILVPKNKMANGGGLANTPESFPETDAMSYKNGGGVDAVEVGGRFYDTRRDKLAEIVSTNKGLISFKYLNKVGTEFSSNNVESLVKNQFDYLVNAGAYQMRKHQMAQGGSTKGFEYSIGGL